MPLNLMVNMALNPEEGGEVDQEDAQSTTEVELDPAPQEKMVVLTPKAESLKPEGSSSSGIGMDSSSHHEGLSLNYEVRILRSLFLY